MRGRTPTANSPQLGERYSFSLPASIRSVAMAIDPEKVHAFVDKAVGDLGAAIGVRAARGDRRQARPLQGLKEGPATSEELAQRTDTARALRPRVARGAGRRRLRHVRCRRGRYFLTEEQAECLTNEESPACVLGGFQSMVSAVRSVAEGDGGLPHRKGRRLARARAGPVPRHRTLLPSRATTRTW